MSDLHFENHGTIITCAQRTDVGKKWLDENVQSEGYQWLGNALCIEHRFAVDIANGAIADGLEVD